MKDIFEETLKCVRCGSCKAYCPTYMEGLSEAMSARGRVILIRNLIRNRLNPSNNLIDDVYSCLLCDACKGQCPLNIDISSIIYEGRRLLAKADKRGRYLRWLIRFLIRYPNSGFKFSKLFGDTFYSYLYRKGVIPFRLKIPDSPLRDEYHVLRPKKKKGRVAIFVGCSTNYLFPNLGVSLINVLLRLGYEVIIPKGEGCCGAPLKDMGLQDEALRMARKNLSIFKKLSVEAILTLCPTCLLFIKYQYGNLVGDLIDKAMDVSVFIENRLQGLEFKRSNIKRVSYHDPCHHIYSFSIAKEPREIMNYAGMDIIEAEEKGCCGFAGLFSINYRGISKALLNRRVESFKKTAAEAIVTACPGCVLQLGSGTDTPVYHIIEIIESLVV